MPSLRPARASIRSLWLLWLLCLSGLSVLSGCASPPPPPAPPPEAVALAREVASRLAEAQREWVKAGRPSFAVEGAWWAERAVAPAREESRLSELRVGDFEDPSYFSLYGREEEERSRWLDVLQPGQEGVQVVADGLLAHHSTGPGWVLRAESPAGPLVLWWWEGRAPFSGPVGQAEVEAALVSLDTERLLALCAGPEFDVPTVVSRWGKAKQARALQLSLSTRAARRAHVAQRFPGSGGWQLQIQERAEGDGGAASGGPGGISQAREHLRAFRCGRWAVDLYRLSLGGTEELVLEGTARIPQGEDRIVTVDLAWTYPLPQPKAQGPR